MTTHTVDSDNHPSWPQTTTPTNTNGHNDHETMNAQQMTTMAHAQYTHTAQDSKDSYAGDNGSRGRW